MEGGQISTVQLVPAAGATLPADLKQATEVMLARAESCLVLRAGAHDLALQGYTDRDKAVLEKLLARRLPLLAWVAAVGGGRIVVQVHELLAAFAWDEPMEVGVDEKIVEDIRRRQRRPLSVEDVCRWLTERVVLEGTPRVLLSAGQRPTPRVTAFRLHGRAHAVDVATGDDGRLRVQRVVEARAPKGLEERRPLVLATVALRFVDATVARELRGVARTSLDRLTAEADNYLALWHQYNELERAAVLERARKMGAWRYVARKSVGDGWRYQLEDPGAFRTLGPEVGAELEVGRERPAWMDGGPWTRGDGRPMTGVLLRQSPEHVTLRVAEDDDTRPPPEGWLYMSLGGDLARLETREAAWSLIVSGESPMPQLGLLILGANVPVGRRGSLEPLSPAARACFRGEPTDRQVDALRIALNTPDIALIQGPPGTGKTEVIAALKVRLAEIAEDREGIGGRFLVSAFQHEAVENAAARVRVLDLPAIKVGRRRGATDVHDELDRWRSEHAERVRAELAGLPEGPMLVALQMARRRISAWLAAPSLRETPRDVARQVMSQLGTHLPPALRDRVMSLAIGVSPPPLPGDWDREMALRAARSLRAEPAGWGDGGPEQAHLARTRLAAILSADEDQLLRRAAAVEGEAPPGLLAELERLRAALLDRLLPQTSRAGPARADADVEALLHEVLAAVHDRVARSADGVAMALEDLHHALEHDAEGVREAVGHYTTVLAATCGQSVGAEMRDHKADSIRFDTVVVDEAARANPLDLFIPLARAERRVVLVGDHRQLAHLLEPDVEGALRGTVSEATREALSMSLFERLFRGLRDGRDPVRVVSLDRQFRMHRVLGALVSRVFYEPHGEGFASPRPDADFAHGLARWPGRVVGWLDVPLSEGAEVAGRSRSRPVEAERVAAEVAALLKDPASTGLSVGVISFYAEQVAVILRALVHHDLAVIGDDGQPAVAADLRARLRVGTVDAFQGREFDVVLLSCTRSSRVHGEGEVERRRRYGHLMVENRLCVAMSRARRLLIAVGDLAMFERGPVPGLAEMAQLCRGAHGLVR